MLPPQRRIVGITPIAQKEKTPSTIYIKIEQMVQVQTGQDQACLRYCYEIETNFLQSTMMRVYWRSAYMVKLKIKMKVLI